MTLTEKAAKMNAEILDMLRNKPVESTLVERWKLIDEASKRYAHLPQPLRLGYGLTYILGNCSLPVKEYDILLGRFDDHVPTPEEEEFVFDFHRRGGQKICVEAGHITLDWAKIFAVGLDGYLTQAKEAYSRCLAGGEHGSMLLFYQGYILMVEALINYIKRYAQAAREAGLYDAAEAAESVAGPAPTTFYGAMMLVMLLQTVYYIYAGDMNPTLTLGRLDDLLVDLYEADIAAGRLDRESAAAIIDDFNAKTNLILGRGEHQMSGGSERDTGWWRNNSYDDPTYVVIGGYSARHPGRVNPLTELFAERINPRYENPVYVFRHTPAGARNERAWEHIVRHARDNASIIIYNDDTVIPALVRAGIAPEDAIEYTMHGCNWVDVPAKYWINGIAGGSVAVFLAHTLYDMLDNEHPKPRDFSSIDEIYEAVGNRFRESVRGAFNHLRNFVRSPEQVPEYISMTQLFTEGVLERGYTAPYAVKYPSCYTLVRHIGTAADIMAAIEDIVFVKKTATMRKLLSAALSDWQHAPDLLAQALAAPKYGTDSDAADKHAVRLMELFTDIAAEEALEPDGSRLFYSLPVTIADMWHVGEGAALPATPDGRRAGAPVSENLSPTPGYARSVTALLRSVAKLPLDRICSGALNLRLSTGSVRGDEGAERLKILADTYFELGGMQLQLSVTDTEVLRDAQEHPEKYPDLMVRITGYSALFVDMCRAAQNEIIRRDELG